MPGFTVRTADQLPSLLQGFRKETGLTQSDVALRLGVTQQTYSALERNAENIGAARLLKLLGILGVEMVLDKPVPLHPTPGQTDTDQPSW
ncbi:XRE family transcriptional regulator [Acidovorax sp. JMULE5]|uniref:helix-turn-helix domain-containing protein n=1 Tax=Acidovorax sp. JMULE5 TaxID=2518343 RepID=UPI0015A4EA66|nr:helix-turn-helix transcriptional regulator [Acidovorax sp. JMULE5]QLA82509.1 XRE family transcriptional regulator [Acidovorax sp. JMULE5]